MTRNWLQRFLHTLRLGARTPLPLHVCGECEAMRDMLNRALRELDTYRDAWRHQSVALEVISVQSMEPDVASLAHDALEYWPTPARRLSEQRHD